MIEHNDFAGAYRLAAADQNDLNLAQSAGRNHSQLGGLWKPGVAALLALTALLAISRNAVHGQVTPLQIMPMAQGSSDENTTQLHVKGPSDVLQTLLVFQAGAETGWHMHPGPVVVVVKSGALTEIHSNGCVTVHPAGSAFFETKGEIHNAVNQTGGVAEVYATFLSPAGAQPLIPQSDPGGVCLHN